MALVLILILGDSGQSGADDGGGGGNGPSSTPPAGSADNLCEMGTRVGPPRKNKKKPCETCAPVVTTPSPDPQPQPKPDKQPKTEKKTATAITPGPSGWTGDRGGSTATVTCSTVSDAAVSDEAGVSGGILDAESGALSLVMGFFPDDDNAKPPR